jgi:DNA-binding transcriptional MerR regulator
MGGKSEFSRKKVAEIVGIPPRRIQFYTDEQLTTPEVSNPKGKRGATRYYSRRNIIDLAIIKSLDAHGLVLSKVKWIMPFIRNELKKYPWYSEGKPGEAEQIQLAIFGLAEKKLKAAFYAVNPKNKVIGVEMDDSISVLILDIGNIVARLGI